MARKVRPVHCWGVVKRDWVSIKGFGDCRVLSDPKYMSTELDIIQFWVMTPCYQTFSVCVPEETYINVVEFVDDDDEEFTEEIERVMICEVRPHERFYFGRRTVKLVKRKGFRTFRVETESRREIDMTLDPFMVVRRVKKSRVLKTKPLSFTEFALSSYEKALGKLAEAVMRLQVDPARVEVQKPTKKAENTSTVITTEDVPSPAPVEPPIRNHGPKTFDCDGDCDRSYCLDDVELKHGGRPLDTIQARPSSCDDHAMTCSDVIAELEEIRLHEGDLPVSIVNPEDGFRRVNVSGTMLEDLYECGETYWGSRTWDTQPRPGNPAKSELVVSLW